MKSTNTNVLIALSFSLIISIGIHAQEGVVLMPNFNPHYKAYDSNQTLIEANLNILNAYYPCQQGKRLPPIHYKLSANASIADLQSITTLEGDLEEGNQDGFVTGMYNSRSNFNDLMVVSRTSDIEGDYKYTVSISYCEQAPLIVENRPISNLVLNGPLVIQDDQTGCQKQGRVITGSINASVSEHNNSPATVVPTTFGLSANTGAPRLGAGCDDILPLNHLGAIDGRRYLGDGPQKNGVYYYGYSNSESYGVGLGMQW
jgi:hypothetical protein